MPDFWLKTLGMGARGSWLPDGWTAWGNGLLERTVIFPPHRPSVKRGDRVVYYAAGWGLIFAEGEATSFPYEASDKYRHWPYRVDIQLDHTRPFVHEGISLDAISVDGRDLRKLMRRRSHIRLTRAEHDAAVRALEGSA